MSLSKKIPETFIKNYGDIPISVRNIWMLAGNTFLAWHFMPNVNRCKYFNLVYVTTDL